MAKLSARNRTEVARVKKETIVENSDLISSQTMTFALMSDGKVLVKRDVVFKPSAWETEPKKHSYGWKLAEAKRAIHDRQLFVSMFLKKGYVEV